MQADCTLTLGSVTFSGVEVPESIAVSGLQRTSIHDLVGGVRIIDAMGAFSEAVEWSGWLVGQTAQARARQLNALRVAGQAITLAWSEQMMLVLVRQCRIVFERFYRVRYTLTCDVVQDQSLQAPAQPYASVDALVSQDMATATTAMATVTSSPLQTAFAAIQSAIAAVSTFATAAQSQINAIVQPIAAFRSQIQLLIASTSNTMQNVTTLGGVLPNNPISTQVAQMTAQTTAAQSLPNLVILDRLMGRVAVNVGANAAGAKQTQVAGGDLLKMASKEYGDHTCWTGIAKANPTLRGDPKIVGTQTLTIPTRPDNTSGGVVVA